MPDSVMPDSVMPDSVMIVTGVNVMQHEVRGEAPDCGEWDAYRCQGRSHILCDQRVVEPDDGDIIWHADASFAQDFDRAKGEAVACREQGRRRVGEL